ncbi:MAG: hypothetical protein NZ772_00015 [Cyanobacteria bacterium]|nr:hypothetical protein [Cyanobacteriota bacterium]MDW8202137.1 hypothetical protein [Cyanobacteriota bacterium SKYGB_h_bin112]
MSHRATKVQPEFWLAGAFLLAGLALLVHQFGLSTIGSGWRLTSARQETCRETIRSGAVLSRHQLSQLLTMASPNSKQTVQAIVGVPYCRLSQIKGDTGTMLDREAYPMEFDPQVWLIVLYEGNTYAGYTFSFRQ